jgi:hypothetical protein
MEELIAWAHHSGVYVRVIAIAVSCSMNLLDFVDFFIANPRIDFDVGL